MTDTLRAAAQAVVDYVETGDEDGGVRSYTLEALCDALRAALAATDIQKLSVAQPAPDWCDLTPGCMLPKHQRNKPPCITEGPHGERRPAPARPAPPLDVERPETQPCTQGPDGGTCDGTDHVQHLIYSCFTGEELQRLRDHPPLDVDRLADAIFLAHVGVMREDTREWIDSDTAAAAIVKAYEEQG